MEDNTQQQPPMSRSNKRAMYRQYGMLKEKSTWSRFSEKAVDWYGRMKEEGNSTQEANNKRMNDDLENQIQIKLDASKKTWKEIGYDEKEIKMLEEAWTIGAFKFKETYKEDKKKAKKLMKTANDSLRKRLDASNNS
tara:strand:+ start:1500 stop:1910 length:411 start_codon:yes stop_codon:yes gene_type:complete